MTAALETHGLTRYFDQLCAVNHVDLKVERGTFYGFLGPNGAGKSTTIKMVTGLLAPSSGRISVLGYERGYVILGLLLLAGGLVGLLFIRPEADRRRLAAHAVALPSLQPARA